MINGSKRLKIDILWRQNNKNFIWYRKSNAIQKYQKCNINKISPAKFAKNITRKCSKLQQQILKFQINDTSAVNDKIISFILKGKNELSNNYDILIQ